MKGIVITPEHEVSVMDFNAPLYKTVGQAVGGGIEIVNPRGLERPFCMVVNDEGLLLDLPFNEVGSYLYQTHIHGSPIVGTIVIMKNGFYNGEPDIVGLSDTEVDALLKKFSTTFSLKGAIT